MPKRVVQFRGLTIEWLGHSTVGVYGEKIIYIDPFSQVLMGEEKNADLIISTHEHRDHFDIDTINKLSNPKTHIIIKSGCNIKGLASLHIKEMEIDETYLVDEIEIKAVHSYNTNKYRSPGEPFHPKGLGMGVIVKIEGVKLYYAGDSDFIEEMKELIDEKIDMAFMPIGGKFTMDAEEAVEAIVAIQPKAVLPVHYNHIKGTEANPMKFKEKVEKKTDTEVIVL